MTEEELFNSISIGTEANDEKALFDSLDVSAPVDTSMVKPSTPVPTVSPEEDIGTTTGASEQNTAPDGIGKYVMDPIEQTGTGFIKAGRVATETLEGVKSPLDLALNPKATVNSISSGINTAIEGAEKATEYLGKKIFGVDVSPKWGRLEVDNTKFPVEKFDKKNQKNQAITDEWLASKDKEYKEKSGGATPIISEVVSYAPDFLMAGIGKIDEVPKLAALSEFLLSGGRNEVEGEGGVGDQLISAGVAGVGTKLAMILSNKLTKSEKVILDDIALNPKLEEDHKVVLKFFMENRDKFNADMLAGKPTGNPYIDNISSNMKDRLGEENYRNYMKAMNSVAGKTELSLKQVASDFAKSSGETYKKFKSSSDEAWDKVSKAMPTNIDGVPISVDADVLRQQLDIELEGSPDVVKAFARRLFESKNYALQVKDIENKIASLKASHNTDMELATEESKKALVDKYKSTLSSLQKEKIGFEGMEADDKLNLNASHLIDKIKKLNNKAYISGGNINTADAEQLHGLGIIRNQLESTLREMPGAEEYVGLLDDARSKSKDIFNLFGANTSGANMGKKVFTPELGKVLGEAAPEQVKIVDSFVNDDPTTFLMKMDHIKQYVDEPTFNNLKKYHIEQKLKKVVDSGGYKSSPKIQIDKFDSAVSEYLDTTDGRELLKNAYGEDMLDTLSFIRSVNKDFMSNVPSTKEGAKSLKAYILGLPKLVGTILIKDIKNYNYLKRHLEAYGESVGIDLADIAKRSITGGTIGASTGVVTSPEGTEEEVGTASALVGMFLGGKYLK